MEANNSDYSKLTVPQLKALCKDRKISGYSKLSKTALLEKLAGLESPNANVTQPASNPSAPGSQAKAVFSGHPLASKWPSSVLRIPVAPVHIVERSTPKPPTIATVRQTLDAQGSPCMRLEQPLTQGPKASAEVNSQDSSGMAPPPSVPQPRPLVPSAPCVPAKRPSTSPSSTSLSKRKKPNALVLPLVLPDTLQSTSVTDLTISAAVVSLHDNGLSANKENTPLAIPNFVKQLQPISGNRFRPLIVRKTSTTKVSICTAKGSRIQKPNPPMSMPRVGSLGPPPPPAVPALTNITMPPPLLQRQNRRVQRWAVILSQVEERDLKQCLLVSRTFRYAVYLSAQERLRQDYEGKRTSRVLKSERNPLATTDFWPYLRYRQHETSERKRLYMRSFFAACLEKYGCPASNVISDRLWSSPDDERQIHIALRFVLTRFWFAISFGGEKSSSWLQSMVIDAQEVIPGDVWSVAFLQANDEGTLSPKPTVMYVLEATCEVIGHPPQPSSTPEALAYSSDVPLRADWSTYIHCQAQATSDSQSSLVSHLKWAHNAEYERGISRLWLTKTAAEGDEGSEKLRVAERYVLASVVANSVSGRWMSSTDMAQDFAGIPSKHGLPMNKPNALQNVSLYLPERHHVESVHFATSAGYAFHPALATVQTPGREYFILRDNGMEVGCEEEGVAPLWMELLGCDNKGLEA